MTMIQMTRLLMRQMNWKSLTQKMSIQQRKRAERAKIYTMNIERKRLLKQRRERTLQNTRGKIPAEEYFLTASKAS